MGLSRIAAALSGATDIKGGHFVTLPEIIAAQASYPDSDLVLESVLEADEAKNSN